MGIFIIISISVLGGLLVYAILKSKKDTFNESVDYAMTMLLMDDIIDGDTYIAYTSLKAGERYKKLHDIDKMESFSAGLVYPEQEIYKKIDKSFDL